MEKNLYELKTNEKFKNLITPLNEQEYQLLEQSIINNGCKTPIFTWNSTIIDGHNRYEICHKHNIPFCQQNTEVKNEEEAVVFICKNQLKRSDITYEARKFLIGNIYIAERIINSRTNNQNKDQHPSITNKINARDISIKIASLYGISEATVRRYAQYVKVVEMLSKTKPEIFKMIKDGSIKFSREDISYYTNLFPKEKVKLNKHRSNIHKIKSNKKFQIKEMPEYNPNAEFESLSHTIPSWKGSIDRLLSHKDIPHITNDVKCHLKQELEKIKFSIETMIYALEVNNERL